MIIRLLCSLSLLFPSAQEASPIVARGAGVELRLIELERTLLERKAMSEEGRSALDQLLKARVVADIAQNAGIKASDRELQEMFSELDRQTRQANPETDLLQELEKRNISVEEFSKILRLAIIQERLTRRTLEIPDDRRASGEEQELWLQQEMAKRGLERPAPPWEDGIVAICGSVRINTEDFAEFLRASLPEGFVAETAWHLLLLRAIERKMPDVAPAALARAIEAEITTREAKHALEYPQISYAQRLGVQGRNMQSVREGPSVRIAALTRMWVDRELGEDGLRKTYTTERQYFDGLFGRAVECYIIFLRAAKFVDPLNKRNFGDSNRLLNQYRDNISDLDDFKALCVKFSDDIESRKRQGALGFVASGTPNVPFEMREAIFGYVDTHDLKEGVMIPNVQLPNGVALLWLDSIQPAPPWEVMQEHVHNELRRRFINSILPRTAVEILPIEPK